MFANASSWKSVSVFVCKIERQRPSSLHVDRRKISLLATATLWTKLNKLAQRANRIRRNSVLMSPTLYACLIHKVLLNYTIIQYQYNPTTKNENSLWASANSNVINYVYCPTCGGPEACIRKGTRLKINK